jgi:hypothetical protein
MSDIIEQIKQKIATDEFMNKVIDVISGDISYWSYIYSPPCDQVEEFWGAPCVYTAPADIEDLDYEKIEILGLVCDLLEETFTMDDSAKKFVYEDSDFMTKLDDKLGAEEYNDWWEELVNFIIEEVESEEPTWE